VFAVRRQVGRVLAAATVIGAVVSGCGNQAGTAVIVGTDVVSLERVQTQLDSVLARPGVAARIKESGLGNDDVARMIVTRAVKHDLLTRKAAASGITISDAAVDATIATQGGPDAMLDNNPVDPAGLRDLVRDGLIATELAKRTVIGQSVTADIVVAASRSDAENKARVLAGGGDAAAALLRDESAHPAQVYSAATNPAAATSVVFGVGVGTVGIFQPDPEQASWIVFKVTDRRADGSSDPAGQISQEQLTRMGERTLQADAAQLGITVNPRYGIWDPILLRVVPKDASAGEIIPPPAPAAG
jgi:hypothetical protein